MACSEEAESDQGLAATRLSSAGHSALKTPIYLQQLALPISQPVRCDVCETPFEIQRGRGRPQKFCSHRCRTAQLKDQKAAWGRRQSHKLLQPALGDRLDVEA